MDRTARRIQQYAGDDAELVAQLAALANDSASVQEVMSPADMKMALYSSYNARKMRAGTGKARRPG